MGKEINQLFSQNLDKKELKAMANSIFGREENPKNVDKKIKAIIYYEFFVNRQTHIDENILEELDKKTLKGLTIEDKTMIENYHLNLRLHNIK